MARALATDGVFASAVLPSASLKRGVDVSSVQPPASVDWAALAAEGVQFAYVKSYEGNKGLDPCCLAHLRNALAAGVKAGVYTFLYPLGHIDPAANALLHANTIADLEQSLGAPLDLPEEVDFEWPPPGPDWTEWGVTGASARSWARPYLEALSLARKRAPLLYIYPNFAQNVNVAADPAFAAYGLSIADYPSKYAHIAPPDGTFPHILAPWTDWVLWQHAGDHGMKLPSGQDVDAYVTRDDTFVDFCNAVDGRWGRGT